MNVAPRDVLVTTRLGVSEAAAEEIKSRVCRALHDDLGGLLGAAIMDIVWTENQSQTDVAVLERVRRIKQTLTKAILLKREIVEQLCPTLIENVGLIAALRWYHRQHYAGSRLQCGATYPTQETAFSATASKILFRIVEEALAMVNRQPTAKAAHLSITVSRSDLSIGVVHDGERLMLDQRTESDLTSLWLVEHRVLGLGGTLKVNHPAPGGMDLKVEIPLRNITEAA